MHIFYDHAIISAPLLKGELEHTAEELKVDLCQFSLEELTRIWNALNQPFRLSVCYEVRIILVDSSIERSATGSPSKRTAMSAHWQVNGMQGYRNSREHVFDELHRLDLLLNVHIARQRRDPLYASFDQFRGRVHLGRRD